MKVLPLPARYRGSNGVQFAGLGVPRRLIRHRPSRFTATVYRGNVSSDPIGVQVSAPGASVLRCGEAFLAFAGHGYRVTCRIRVDKQRPVPIALSQHDALTALAAALHDP